MEIRRLFIIRSVYGSRLGFLQELLCYGLSSRLGLGSNQGPPGMCGPSQVTCTQEAGDLSFRIRE